MAIKCVRCGHEGTFLLPRAVYACQAPHCQVYHQPICHNCWIEMGARTGALGTPERCAICYVGELKYLGNR